MAKKSHIQIAKMPGEYPPYEVSCNSESHDGGWIGAETLAEAKEYKASPENWCMGCNSEAKGGSPLGRQF